MCEACGWHSELNHTSMVKGRTATTLRHGIMYVMSISSYAAITISAAAAAASKDAVQLL